MSMVAVFGAVAVDDRRQRQARNRAAVARYQASPKGRSRGEAWRAANKGRLYAAHLRHRARHGNPPNDPEYQRRYRAEHREQRNALERTRVARIAAAPGDGVTADQWAAILEAHPYCDYCGQRNVKLVMEHMTPISRGGAHDVSNVIPACAPCNTRKRSRTAAEYREAMTCP